MYQFSTAPYIVIACKQVPIYMQSMKYLYFGPSFSKTLFFVEAIKYLYMIKHTAYEREKTLSEIR